MLKKALKVFTVIIIILVGISVYFYFRLHNDIENVLESSEEWRSEVLEFPLIFADDLDYEGEEHIRFAPGWGDPTSEDYFSYVFVWILKDKIDFNPSEMEEIINTYFDGLMNTGALTNFNFFKKIPKTKSKLESLDSQKLTGEIVLYDEFFSKKQLKLRALIISESCPLKEKELIWFYLSPQDKDHHIWTEFKQIHLNMKCR